MVDPKKLSMNVQDGDAFFAHETSVNYSPNQFILDFKSVTPRIDPRAGPDPVIVLKHNLVLIDPMHAKKLAEFLNNVVVKYEKDFGKIDKSQALIKHEKRLKRKSKTKEKIEATPEYFG